MPLTYPDSNLQALTTYPNLSLLCTPTYPYGPQVVDTIWIVIQPSCVLAGVPALVAHHTATLLFALVPYLEPRYHWHLTVTLAVEVSISHPPCRIHA